MNVQTDTRLCKLRFHMDLKCEMQEISDGWIKNYRGVADNLLVSSVLYTAGLALLPMHVACKILLLLVTM